MNRRMFLAVAGLSVMLIAGLQPAHAGTAKKAYETSGPFFSISGVEGALAETATTDGTLDIGAVRFAVGEYNHKTSIDIRVQDLVNPFGEVGITACQDLDGDASCGENADGITQFEDEPSVSGCLTGGLKTSDPKLTMTGIVTDRGEDSDIVIFVNTVDVCSSQPYGGATSGEIKIWF